MKLFKWLAREIFTLLGGFSLGFSIPMGQFTVTGSQEVDMVIFLPLGILLLGISYYYNFVDKS